MEGYGFGCERCSLVWTLVPLVVNCNFVLDVVALVVTRLEAAESKNSCRLLLNTVDLFATALTCDNSHKGFSEHKNFFFFFLV